MTPSLCFVLPCVSVHLIPARSMTHKAIITIAITHRDSLGKGELEGCLWLRYFSHTIIPGGLSGQNCASLEEGHQTKQGLAQKQKSNFPSQGLAQLGKLVCGANTSGSLLTHSPPHFQARTAPGWDSRCWQSPCPLLW